MSYFCFLILSFQPYREVFEYVIENFKTYKPLLSSIKQEYEGMLSKQNDAIKSLEPLKVFVIIYNLLNILNVNDINSFAHNFMQVKANMERLWFQIVALEIFFSAIIMCLSKLI